MVGWHHQLEGHELEQAPGVGDGQGSLACCSPWGHKKSDKTKRLNCVHRHTIARRGDLESFLHQKSWEFGIDMYTLSYLK